MSFVQILPLVAAASIIMVMLVIANRHVGAKTNGIWVFPAILSGLFSAWTLVTIIAEGPLAFWTEHTRNLWGNQIWFDLLLAVGAAWCLILPRAKPLGMRVLLWLVLILCTGSIGLLAMLSRLLFLEQKLATGA